MTDFELYCKTNITIPVYLEMFYKTKDKSYLDYAIEVIEKIKRGVK